VIEGHDAVVDSNLQGKVAMKPVRSYFKSAQGRIQALATSVRWFGLLREGARAGAHGMGQIKTFTARDELATLYDLARSLPDESVVLEIGSYLGASACVLGLALKESRSKLICVDTWNNETMPEGTLDTLSAFRTNTHTFHNMITVVRKRSEDLGPDDVPGQVALAFIDGDHSYESVRVDIERVLPFMASNAIIAFHDAAGGFFPGVSRAFGELLASGQFVFLGATRSLAWAKRSQ
jgi:predicted O-methyltransferase YrrM